MAILRHPNSRINNLHHPLLGLAAILLGTLATAERSHCESFVYDLQANGLESSFVDECTTDAEDSCLRITIGGTIQITTDLLSPTIENIDSIIYVPPQLPGDPPVFSPEPWGNLDLFEGEYLPVEDDADALVRFAPPTGGPVRLYELFATLSDDFATLTLTGGIHQETASPSEPHIVRFNVNGRRVTSPETLRPTVPAPAGVSLAMILLGSLTAASRWRR